MDGTPVRDPVPQPLAAVDVLCNGIALARRLDIFKEVGAGRALIEAYHGLRPNAQGKLIVSFVPDVNYASADAIEVEQEGP